MHRLIAVVALALLAAACQPAFPVASGATPSPIGPGQSGAPTPGATATPGPSGPSAEIDLDITGGPHNGSYRGVASNACANDEAHNKFTVNYTDNSAADGFIALDLVLNDAAEANADQSNDFVAHLSLEGAGAGISYTLDPKNSQGKDGEAYLDTSTPDATVDVEVDTADGASISLTVLCSLD
jgi:hypothetical protein